MALEMAGYAFAAPDVTGPGSVVLSVSPSDENFDPQVWADGDMVFIIVECSNAVPIGTSVTGWTWANSSVDWGGNVFPGYTGILYREVEAGLVGTTDPQEVTLTFGGLYSYAYGGVAVRNVVSVLDDETYFPDNGSLGGSHSDRDGVCERNTASLGVATHAVHIQDTRSTTNARLELHLFYAAPNNGSTGMDDLTVADFDTEYGLGVVGYGYAAPGSSWDYEWHGLAYVLRESGTDLDTDDHTVDIGFGSTGGSNEFLGGARFVIELEALTETVGNDPIHIDYVAPRFRGRALPYDLTSIILEG